jgi:hypothetical protein
MRAWWDKRARAGATAEEQEGATDEVEIPPADDSEGEQPAAKGAGNRQEISASDRALLAAVKGAGIQTASAFTEMQGVAMGALTEKRTKAKAAAVAFFGQSNPAAITAAEKVIDGMGDLSMLDAMTKTYLDGAPGAGRANARQTRPAGTTPAGGNGAEPAEGSEEAAWDKAGENAAARVSAQNGGGK